MRLKYQFLRNNWERKEENDDWLINWLIDVSVHSIKLFNLKSLIFVPNPAPQVLGLSLTACAKEKKTQGAPKFVEKKQTCEEMFKQLSKIFGNHDGWEESYKLFMTKYVLLTFRPGLTRNN